MEPFRVKKKNVKNSTYYKNLKMEKRVRNVRERFQMSFLFCRKIKRLIHWPEKHVTGLLKQKRREFGKLETPSVAPEDANKILEKAA